jgi:hypothetical protein
MPNDQSDSSPVSRRDSHASGARKKAVDVAARLQALEDMDNVALREEWRRLYRVAPPKRIRRDLLLLAVAWKIQEQAFGGLSAATKRRLVDLADGNGRSPNGAASQSARLKPGARLVREWQGRTHTVTVTEDGFHWNGKTWRSLTKIAGQITGSHWSGPRFFGLKGSSAVTMSGADTGASDEQ